VDAGEQARRRAGSLSVPTLMLVAGSDRLVRPEGSRVFAQGAPKEHVTLHVYDPLFHELFNELEADRQRVLGDLEGWLSGRFGA
jgi:alpha-beta hydrolase superfamily lysophospholipase